jgi:hypothetical protein
MGKRIDAEYHALRAGLKPAIRASARPEEVAAMVARYEAFGCVVLTAEAMIAGPRSSSRHPIEVLYIARAREEAEALRAAEEPLRSVEESPIDQGVAAMREVGLRLGYPPCCVEACCARYRRRCEAARFDPGTPAQAYYAARDAWTPNPRWQLDDLMFAARASVISFEPCTYVCDAATSYADALLAVLARIDPEARSVLESQLKRNVAIDTHGGRAIVSLDASRQIVRSEPLRSLEGRALDDANEALAPRLLGRVVAEDGSVVGTGERPAIVIAFAG